MKKRVVLAVLLTLVGFAVCLMPSMVESNVPAVYYITPKFKTYESVISASGTIQSGEVRQMYLSSAAVIGKVLVAVGDPVEEGEPILQIDKEKTEKMRLPLNLIRESSEELDASSLQAVDWASMASAYGLSAVVSGGNAGLNSDLLSELLGQSGLLNVATSGSAVDAASDGGIVAPISGVVTEISVQAQSPVVAGKPIVTIADNSHYKVLVSIREEDIGRIQLGDEAQVRGVGFSGSTYTGSITSIHPTARKTFNGATADTVVDAEITLRDADERLKPGFSAKVEILGGNNYDLITVPYEAIKQDENNNEYVYLYENGKLKKQVVVTGQELTSEVEILSGVSINSVVVHNPSDQIHEGAMIHIKGRADVY